MSGDERRRGATTTVVGGRVVTPDGIIEDGVVEIADGHVLAVSRTPADDPPW